MKTRSFFLLLTAVLGLFACKDSGSDMTVEPSVDGQIDVNRADIAGAEYLTLLSQSGGDETSKSSSDFNLLYKIDKDGKMTAVVFYTQMVSTNNGGTATEKVSVDLTVSPRFLQDLGKGYVLLGDCTMKPVPGTTLTPPPVEPCSFLVRKADGSVFKMGNEEMYRYFRDVSENRLKYDARGDLYILTLNGVVKLKTEGNKLLLQELTTNVSGPAFLLDNAGNFFMSEPTPAADFNLIWSGRGIFYFTGGSVTQIPSSGWLGCLLTVDNEFYELRAIEQSRDASTLKLCKAQVNASQILFEETASIDIAYPCEVVNYIKLVETPDKVILLHSTEAALVYDKATRELTEKTIPIEFGQKTYNKNGISYTLTGNNTQIERYSIIDLSHRTILCDRSSVPPFILTGTTTTLTEQVEFGIKNTNGAPIRVSTDFETGKVTVKEDQDNRKIITLVKVN